MIRQLAGLLLAFAMLHVSVARVDVACAMHDHDAPATNHAGMQHDDPPADESPCETPATPDCCLALASCAPTIGIDEGSIGSIAAIGRVTVAAAASDRPLSRSTAPEPPPPKA